ncbi:uncharacterized protein LOC112551387 [Alligator sinensis]|uniref:Uncharacterized protein LOC112551387 n=1 Tax=Alligator sinensis TaxID=38654 RepID=A0A3Q0H7C3_ALLSI|nr:uncharacterized protein LOC112551387 [Alligator sinensis]
MAPAKRNTRRPHRLVFPTISASSQRGFFLSFSLKEACQPAPRIVLSCRCAASLAGRFLLSCGKIHVPPREVQREEGKPRPNEPVQGTLRTRRPLRGAGSPPLPKPMGKRPWEETVGANPAVARHRGTPQAWDRVVCIEATACAGSPKAAGQWDPNAGDFCTACVQGGGSLSMKWLPEDAPSSRDRMALFQSSGTCPERHECSNSRARSSATTPANSFSALGCSSPGPADANTSCPST